MSHPTLPGSISEVVSALKKIISECEKQNSPLVYFATLYCSVTERVERGIQQGEFQDNGRMERLDVIFANRYLEAYWNFKAGKPHSEAWKVAFQAAQEKKIILQHIFLGINAHINLDLGIAASETVGSGNDLRPLKADFDAINQILSELTDEAQEEIGKISPVMKWLDKWMKNSDEALARFSIGLARDGAWKFSNEYHGSSDKAASTKTRDLQIAKLGGHISAPKGIIINSLLYFIRLSESSKLREITGILRRRR